jgi:hypothetical protein
MKASTDQARLQGLAKGDLSVIDTLERLTIGSFKDSGLDPRTFMLVRLAALATLDAAPVSWMTNLAVAGKADVKAEDAIGVLIALAPLIGTARVVAASGAIIRALGMAEMIDEKNK